MSFKGLGRGLDALLPADLQAAGIEMDIRTNQILNMPIDDLIPNENQPRKTMTPEGLEELAKSIQRQGVIQPLLVRRSQEPGKYQIIAGERRWRAARMAQITEVPVYLREMSDSDVMLVALIENLQREDLNAAEEAQALQDLKDQLHLTQEELAIRLGKSRSKIANSLRLLQLPKEALACLQDGRISAGHARCLLAFADHPEHVQGFLSYILDHKLSVRDCEDVLSTWKQQHTLPWLSETPQAPQEPRKRFVKSAAFKQIEKDLSSLHNCRARLSGNAQTGRISFIYKNEEELQQLLNNFGLSSLAEYEQAPEDDTSSAEAAAEAAADAVGQESSAQDSVQESLQDRA